MATFYPALEQQGIIGYLKSANMNSTADQAIDILPGARGQTYIIESVTVVNGSIALTTASGAIYTATAKGGSSVISTGAVFNSINPGTQDYQRLATTTATTNIKQTLATLYLSLTTPQGAAATADIIIWGYAIPDRANTFKFGATVSANPGTTTMMAADKQVYGYGKTFDFNSTADQPIQLRNLDGVIHAPRIFQFVNPSGSFTTSAGGIYTGAGKTGTTCLAAATTYTTLNPGTVDRIIKTPAAVSPATNTYYFALTTPQGSAATADVLCAGGPSAGYRAAFDSTVINSKTPVNIVNAMGLDANTTADQFIKWTSAKPTVIGTNTSTICSNPTGISSSTVTNAAGFTGAGRTGTQVIATANLAGSTAFVVTAPASSSTNSVFRTSRDFYFSCTATTAGAGCKLNLQILGMSLPY